MPTSRVRDDSPAGRVVVRSFRKLSQIRRNVPVAALARIGKKDDIRHAEDLARVPSKKRSAKAKGLPKKPKKLSNASSGTSGKFRQLPAKCASGTPGSVRQLRRRPSHARVPRTDLRPTQLSRPQLHIRNISGPGGIETPAGEMHEVVAKNLKIIDQVALGTQQYSEDPPEEISQTRSSPPVALEPPIPDEPVLEVVDQLTDATVVEEAVDLEEAVESLPQPQEPAQLNAPVTSRAVATLLATARPDPVSITAVKLELEIAQATKVADPSCAEFVGVVVQRVKPKSSSDANWTLRGIKFGRSDRKAVDEILTTIVERMQREFRLSDG
jgi:hypothetical protein